MSDYERVTFKQGKPKIVSKRVYERLQELENKIEDGSLRFMPCKVGQEVYVDRDTWGNQYIVYFDCIGNKMFYYGEIISFVITKKQSFGSAFGITSLIGLLYGFFYILLRLQDIAHFVGSIGLFIIVAAIMYLTRNANWYNEE